MGKANVSLDVSLIQADSSSAPSRRPVNFGNINPPKPLESLGCLALLVGDTYWLPALGRLYTLANSLTSTVEATRPLIRGCGILIVTTARGTWHGKFPGNAFGCMEADPHASAKSPRARACLRLPRSVIQSDAERTRGYQQIRSR